METKKDLAFVLIPWYYYGDPRGIPTPVTGVRGRVAAYSTWFYYLFRPLKSV